MERLECVRRLRGIEMRVADFDAAVAFYGGAWGLEPVADEPGSAWFRGSGEEHHVLGLHRADVNAVDRISFAAATPDEVEYAAAVLAGRGVPLLKEPGPSSRPGGGYTIELPDPDGRRIELAAELPSVAVRPQDESRPVGVTHVVLNTPDLERALAFYVEVLGFRVSDWSERQMVFLRCNDYHHAVAFNRASWASVNHVAYEVGSVDGYMRAIGRLRVSGSTPLWGPGRHGPGNNTFAYFQDPAGLVCEYTAEVERIDEATWVPRVWPRVPELSDLWGTAGAPSPETRAAMAGVVDDGAFADRPELGEGSWRTP